MVSTSLYFLPQRKISGKKGGEREGKKKFPIFSLLKMAFERMGGV
jgi:hypothetical protein